MADPPNSHGDRTPQPDAVHPNDSLGALRDLLFGDEKRQLERVQQRLDRPELRAQDVAQVLPQAIRERAAADEQLGEALGPTIVSALHASIEKEPGPLVDAIAPVMGPAIRRAISQAIRGMVQGLNRTMEQSLSWRGWQWRLEAWRTGTSFGEVAMLHSLVYRVEHVFLIHRASGLLLHHVGIDAAAVEDADLVSGMLTAIQSAIQDFAEDSFGERDTLQSLRLSQWTLWIEPGSAAVLGIVIRGEPPESLRGETQAVLEQIHVDQRRALDHFKGDTAAFETTHDRLAGCLQSQFREGERAGFPVKAVAVLGVAAVALLAALGSWGYLARQETRRWNDFVQRLQDEPGIAVTIAERRQRKYFVSGLRDPSAREPAEILRETALDVDRVHFQWETYYSLDPHFTMARIERFLTPPSTVQIALHDGTIRLTGSAPHAWIATALPPANHIPGVLQVDAKALRDEDLQQLERLSVKLGQFTFYFAGGSHEPIDRDGLEAVAETIQQVLAAASAAGRQLVIHVEGHAADGGEENRLAQEISEARAEHLRDALVVMEVPAERLQAVGQGASRPVAVAEGGDPVAASRRVTFAAIDKGPWK